MSLARGTTAIVEAPLLASLAYLLSRPGTLSPDA
jgi:hypothetical protein